MFVFKQKPLHLHDCRTTGNAVVCVSTDEIPGEPLPCTKGGSGKCKYESLIYIEPKGGNRQVESEFIVRYDNREKAIRGHEIIKNALANLEGIVKTEKEIVSFVDDKTVKNILANSLSDIGYIE